MRVKEKREFMDRVNVGARTTEKGKTNNRRSHRKECQKQINEGHTAAEGDYSTRTVKSAANEDRRGAAHRPTRRARPLRADRPRDLQPGSELGSSAVSIDPRARMWFTDAVNSSIHL